MSCQMQRKFDGHPKIRMGVLDARAVNCVDVRATCEWKQVEGAKDTLKEVEVLCAINSTVTLACPRDILVFT